jgi:hypothetical protein
MLTMQTIISGQLTSPLNWLVLTNAVLMFLCGWWARKKWMEEV